MSAKRRRNLPPGFSNPSGFSSSVRRQLPVQNRRKTSDGFVTKTPEMLHALVFAMQWPAKDLKSNRPGSPPLVFATMKGVAFKMGLDTPGRKVSVKAFIAKSDVADLLASKGSLAVYGFGMITKRFFRPHPRSKQIAVYEMNLCQGAHNKFTIAHTKPVPLTWGAVVRTAQIMDLEVQHERIRECKARGAPIPRPLTRTHQLVVPALRKGAKGWVLEHRKRERAIFQQHCRRMAALRRGHNTEAKASAMAAYREEVTQLDREIAENISNIMKRLLRIKNASQLAKNLAGAITEHYKILGACEFYTAEQLKLVHPKLKPSLVRFVNKHPLPFALNRTILRVPKRGAKELDGDGGSNGKVEEGGDGEEDDIHFNETNVSDMDSDDDAHFDLAPGIDQSEVDAMAQRAALEKTLGDADDDDEAIEVSVQSAGDADRRLDNARRTAKDAMFTINVEDTRKRNAALRQAGGKPDPFAQFKRFHPSQRCNMTRLPRLREAELSKTTVGQAALESSPGVPTALAILEEASRKESFVQQSAFTWNDLAYRIKGTDSDVIADAHAILVDRFNTFVRIDCGSHQCDKWGNHVFYVFPHRDRVARKLCHFFKMFAIRAQVAVQRQNAVGSKMRPGRRVPWPLWSPDAVKAHITKVVKEKNLRLDATQFQTVFDILTNPGIHAIQGAGGTGKTTAMRAVFHCIATKSSQKKRVLLLGPTATAKETIGHALGVPNQAFTMDHLFFVRKIKNTCDPLCVTHVFIDEASMINPSKMMRTLWFLRLLPNLTCIVFLGDIRQIGPIGPGHLFQDLLQAPSPLVFAHRFTKVYRTDLMGISTCCNMMASAKFSDIRRAHSSACSVTSGWSKGSLMKSPLGPGLWHFMMPTPEMKQRRNGRGMAFSLNTTEEITTCLTDAINKSITGGIAKYNPEELRVVGYRRIIYGPIVSVLRIAAHRSRKTPASLASVPIMKLPADQFLVGDFVRCTENTKVSVEEETGEFITKPDGKVAKKTTRVEHINITNGSTWTIVSAALHSQTECVKVLAPNAPFVMRYNKALQLDLVVTLRCNLKTMIQFGLMTREVAEAISKLPFSRAGIKQMESMGAMMKEIRFSKKAPNGFSFIRFGYTSTAHSAQGQQFDTSVVLVQPNDPQDVLYTAFSRASNKLVIVAPDVAFSCIRKTRTRRTILSSYLKFDSLLPIKVSEVQALMESDQNTTEKQNAQRDARAARRG